MSQIEVNKIIPQSGTSTQLGESGDTITIPAGATITNNGTANGFGSADTEKVKVSANDTTAGFLNGKLVAGTNISLTEGTDGGNETLTAALTGTIATAQIADDAVTLAKMAPGTDGNIISYDASGNPVAVATGSSGQVLTSAGAGAQPAFATIAGGLTEVDLLRKSANQAISASTASVVTANWERDDTLSEKIGNGMSESSGVFTFPSSGIYLIQSQMYLYGFGASGAESAQYVQLLIQGTANNSSFVTLVDSSIPATANTGVRYVTNRAHTIFDCVDTSTHKVKFQVWIQGKSGTLYGSSSVNASFASFIKLGDT